MKLPCNEIMNTFLANKSSASNIIALAITLIGIIFQVSLIKTIGFFALSGALTNWLAVYMLFEKVPFLYGSGVIPERFVEFKTAIKQLMMQQFFTVQNIAQFIDNKQPTQAELFNFEPLLNTLDYDNLYQALVSSIMESSFGAMLQMMGGAEALAPLKVPFCEKMRLSLVQLTQSEAFNQALQSSITPHKISDALALSIEAVIDKRLNELTPQLVKEMVQLIIHEHLGWLVVWGAVAGGFMGLVFEVLA